jgi:hypothetical protein
MCVPKRFRDSIYTSPLPLPLDMPGAFQLTDPVLAGVLDAARQRQGQNPVVKGIVGVRKVAFLFQLPDDLPRDLCPFFILQTVHPIMQ